MIDAVVELSNIEIHEHCMLNRITCENEFIKTLTIEKWKKQKMPDIEKVPAIFLIGK